MKKLITALLFGLLAATVAAGETHPLLMNGKLFGTVIVAPNGVWAVSIEDFAKSGGVGPTLQPFFTLQGSKLGAIPPPILPATQPRLEQRVDAILIRQRLFRVQRPGEISSRVFTVDGKAYIPLADIVEAFGMSGYRQPLLKPGDPIRMPVVADGRAIHAPV